MDEKNECPVFLDENNFGELGTIHRGAMCLLNSVYADLHTIHSSQVKNIDISTCRGPVPGEE